jgi:hypothetical protein
MVRFWKAKATSLLLLLVFVITFAVRVYDIFSPYGRTILAAGSTNFWHIAGENYLRFGYFPLWFTPVLNTGINLPLNFYINHPSLLAFYLSLFYLLFGSSVLVTKLAACAGWYGVSFLIFKLGTLRSKRLGYFALIASLLLPFTNIFSNCADSIGGPLVVFLSLLYFYLLEKRASVWKINLICWLASFSEWSFIPLWATCLFMDKYSKYRISLLISSVCILILLSGLWLFGYFRIHNPSADNQLGLEALINFLQWLSSSNWLASFKYSITAIGNHVSSSVPIEKWFSRLIFTYITTFFTPLIFIGSYFIFKTHRTLYLPLLVQPLAMILLFPHGAFKHAFWISTLVPFASLALAVFFTKLRRKMMVVVVLVTLIFSTFYSVFFKERDKTHTYIKIGTYLKQNTLPNQVLFINLAGEASDHLSELLLIGYYSKRDLQAINLPKVEDILYFYTEKSKICRIVDLKTL